MRQLRQYLKATLFMGFLFFLLGLITLPTLRALIVERRMLGGGPEALIGVAVGHAILGVILYFVYKSGTQAPADNPGDENAIDLGTKVMLIYLPLAAYAAGLVVCLLS
jgi:hypothetical protein